MKRLALAAFGLFLAAGCDKHASTSGDGAKAGGKYVLEFDLSSGAPETATGSFLVPTAASRTYTGLIRAFERAASDSRASALFLKLGDASMGWAHAEEIGYAFSRLREKTGKPVVCHATAVDNRTAWVLARACTKTWVSPASDVDTVGIAGQVVYLKSALDKLKITADFLHMGRYKSASETLTQDGPSDEARESLTAVLSSMRKSWIDGENAARKRDVGKALEDGPWSPEDARTEGLIDAVGYESEARADAQTLGKTTETESAFGGKRKQGPGFEAAELLRLVAGGEPGTKKPHIAVLAAEGSIAMGKAGSFGESGITETGMRRAIKKLTEDDSVKAVVLRIDSPGGSALASDLIWHDLMELRKKKPLVASVGDMAASGGYYLACAANVIVAPETSIVGSIGVLGGKIVVSGALEDVGVHSETFPASSADGAGPRAAYLSALTPWDDATREKVRREMSSVYELFLKRVAEGRGLPVELIRAVAEGRIWSGIQGQRIRLVDELGGLGKALDVARKRANLDAEAPIVLAGVSETFLESLFGGDDGDDANESRALSRFTGAATPEARFLDAVAEPVRKFVATLAPLADGETTLVALPFGLVIR
ncbi:MAG TPA: signal peptide peptidase SppA [Polyangiaceae bacterium]|nr:signal peptide peptidase SppA [Polyangiaceae bacterium]